MAIKICKENGHKYDSTEYDHCPYCPDKTVVLNTQVDDMQPNDQTAMPTERTEMMGTPSTDRTAIHKTVSEEKGQDSSIQAGRKLVGWLVSFTWNSEGEDYQLREGKTLIGADKKCDVVVSDNEVSGHHTTILYRGGKFKIKDEFSTNGTRIDGNEIEDQTDLEDGNTITVGNTDFIFRKI